MAFRKTGDVVVDKILCSCGAEIVKPAVTCAKCGKNLVEPALQTPVAPPPSNEPIKP